MTDAANDFKIQARDLNLHYGEKHALRHIDLQIEKNKVTALIGPSGCGKSTFLRCLNRMNDLIESAKITGKVLVDGMDVYAKDIDPVLLRRKVGMIFQKSNPFPKSIFENIAYGPRIHGIKDKKTLDEIVEKSLRGAALWDEVKDDLSKSKVALIYGQMTEPPGARTRWPACWRACARRPSTPSRPRCPSRPGPLRRSRCGSCSRGWPRGAGSTPGRSGRTPARSRS